MNKRSLIIGLSYTLALAPTLWAIGPIFTPEQMHKMATHVVTGKVEAIYKRTAQQGDWEYTYYLAEISVNESEKGEDVKRGDEIFIRYWNRRWIGNGPVSTSGMGQRGKPAEGDSIRAYLNREAENRSAVFKVAAENGFEKLE